MWQKQKQMYRLEFLHSSRYHHITKKTHKISNLYIFLRKPVDIPGQDAKLIGRFGGKDDSGSRTGNLQNSF